MSITTTPRHTSGPAETSSRHTANAATLALARTESRRLLRHPVVLAATALVLAGWIVPVFTGSATKFPLLYLEDSAISFQTTLIAAAAMIAVNLAVLRAHRHSVTVFTDVLTLPAWRRTLAHLLSLLPLAAAAGLLTVARIAQLGLQPGAAGRADPSGLAVVPTQVLLFGAAGVLLARLTRSTVAAPLLLVLTLFFWAFASTSDGAETRLSRLIPAPFDPQVGIGGPLPAQVTYEPAGAHLLYLLALAVVIAAAALLRAGAPLMRTALVAAVALLVVVTSGAVQLRPTPAEITARSTAMTNQPSRFHDCVTRGTVTYCAFPEFTSWTDGWQQVVDGVRRRVPAEQAKAPLTVRQRTVAANIKKTGALSRKGSAQTWQADDRRAGTPDAISVGTQWGTAVQEIGFAAHVAHRVVTGSGIAEERVLTCGGPGVLTVWLAAQSTPAAGKGLPELINTSSGSRYKYFAALEGGENIEIGIREITVAQQLLDQPADQVAAAINRSWPQLTSPKTTVEQAATLLGTTAPAKLAPLPAEELAGYAPGYFKECG